MTVPGPPMLPMPHHIYYIPLIGGKIGGAYASTPCTANGSQIPGPTCDASNGFGDPNFTAQNRNMIYPLLCPPLA